jgi:beta-N-acetylhexosaminidase
MSPPVARAEGEATGVALRSVGINVDLAPVADVERVTGSFLHTRAFGSNASRVAEDACSFAEGLASKGVGYTLKHFPGLGRALTNTDTQSTTIPTSAAGLRADYLPYQTCGAQPGALVMVSSAIYPGLGSSRPAVLTPQIYKSELPSATGSTPVTISDDLQAAGLRDESAPAERAINAGLDLLLYAQTEAGSESAFHRLVEVAKAGGIKRESLEAARLAILVLKGTVAGPTPSSTGEASAGQQPDSENPGAPETVAPQVESRK